MDITQLPYGKIKKLLSGVEKERFKVIKHSGKLAIPKGVGDLENAHKKYLKGRNYNWKELQTIWQIQGIGIAQQLAWRVFIPIHYKGEMVSWTTRSIAKNPQVTRYISASDKEESMPHKELLYGEDYAHHAIIVCEGPIDVWRIGPGAVAVMGVGYSTAQVAKMVDYPVRVVCFDNERVAQQRASRLCNDLSTFPGETYNVTLGANDADTADYGDIVKLRKKFLN